MWVVLCPNNKTLGPNRHKEQTDAKCSGKISGQCGSLSNVQPAPFLSPSWMIETTDLGPSPLLSVLACVLQELLTTTNLHNIPLFHHRISQVPEACHCLWGKHPWHHGASLPTMIMHYCTLLCSEHYILCFSIKCYLSRWLNNANYLGS